jgi:hypothetical protein
MAHADYPQIAFLWPALVAASASEVASAIAEEFAQLAAGVEPKSGLAKPLWTTRWRALGGESENRGRALDCRRPRWRMARHMGSPRGTDTEAALISLKRTEDFAMCFCGYRRARRDEEPEVHETASRAF